ncbi:MAG: DUF3048 domain-containing protein [Candidatus Magasanikbacteria bacterium]|nr:DUF3048 domain-containing protein [Candidatus Magasanikbacteria bacterium]MBT4071133.1 DUF3048 domain-containing protein [Candidatus Magasanikbacteria bacterium]
MKKNVKKDLKKYLRKIKKWQKKKGVDSVHFVYALAGVVGLVALLLVLFFSRGFFQTEKGDMDREVEEFVREEVQEVDCEHMRLLDGVCVSSAEDIAPGIIGIMIENHIEARPLAGLSQARVVYEAPVEGNITRFFALFLEADEVAKVGPVRSARPYYLDWLAEYGDAMYMHVGGSPEALDRIASTDVFDMNEFSRGWYFWRGKDRGAPHNTYTSSELWQDAYEKYSPDNAHVEIDAWKFNNDGEVCEEDCITDITIAFERWTYKAHWVYNVEEDYYKRYESGRRHIDQGGTPIIANTIIVQHVDAQVIDNVGRLRVDTIGEGDVDIFVHGKHLSGIWKKENVDAKTRWYDDSGEEIAIAPGVIWISVLSGNGELTVEE